MEFTNEEMVKSLTSLIDETLEEIEEIKKSKFAASEISLGDDKSGVTALQKSSEEVEPLSKSEIASKLFELKKTGKSVDSADIFKVETGNDLTVLQIANKYGLR